MAQQLVNIGTVANDDTGDSPRVAFGKINADVEALYGDVALQEAPKPVIIDGNAPVSMATVYTALGTDGYRVGAHIEHRYNDFTVTSELDGSGWSETDRVMSAGDTVQYSAVQNIDAITEANVLSYDAEDKTILLYHPSVTVEGLSFKVEGQVWEDLPRTPTLNLGAVPYKWHSRNENTAIILELFSAVATNDVICIALRCDDPGHEAPAYRAAGFEINWAGLRRFSIALNEFTPLLQHPELLTSGNYLVPSPEGIEQATEMYLFSRMWGQNPNPNTRLRIRDIRFGAPVSDTQSAYLPTVHVENEVEVYGNTYLPYSHNFGHSQVEVSGDAEVSPFQHLPYFQAERSQKGYYPQYFPGEVSISTTGERYVIAGNYIQRLVAGVWQRHDLFDDLIPYVKGLGMSQILINNGFNQADSHIRFDSDGDAYVLINVADKANTLIERKCYLMHSDDNMASWTVYGGLPHYLCRFEKMMGRNWDALQYPPAIICNDGTLIVTTKSAGVLDITTKRETVGAADGFGYADDHSGSIGHIVSVKDNIYFAFGRLNQPTGTGALCYVQAYNRSTEVLGSPVLIGEGGISNTDGHNYPAITADDSGVLHAVLNGHHNPFGYVASTSPDDNSAWTAQTLHSAGTSYLGLVCGADGTLYSMSRNSRYSYTFHLMLHKRTTDGTWSESSVIIPCKGNYQVYYHRLTIDPRTDDLYLFYWGVSYTQQSYQDEHAAFMFRTPDLSIYNGLSAPVGVSRSIGSSYGSYSFPQAEPSLLVSKNGGDTWKLVETGDMAFKHNSQLRYTGSGTATVKIITGGGYDYPLDWGDGTTATGVSNVGQSHTYAASSDVVLKISTLVDRDPRVMELTGSFTGTSWDLPRKLTSLTALASTALHGDEAGLPRTLTTYVNNGVNTSHGDVADLPPGLLTYNNQGSNTVTGDIADLPVTLLTFTLFGNNTTYGEITDLPNTVTTYSNKGNSTVRALSVPVLGSEMKYFLQAGTAFRQTDIDNVLEGLDTHVTTWSSSKTVDLRVAGGYTPSAGGLVFKSNLEGKGVTVLVNT